MEAKLRRMQKCESDEPYMKRHIQAAKFVVRCDIYPHNTHPRISNLMHLFEYLRESNTYIEALSTKRLSMFTGWLDRKPFSDEKKNDIANSVERLIDFMQMLNLLRPGLVVFEHRWKTAQKEPVRAPERQIVEQLDLHFFDLENDAPSDMRCCYMTLRLIISRIDEVLNTPLDAVRHYHDDIFLVRNPSRKGQPFGIPREEDYAFYKDGIAEGIFLKTLLEQKNYADSKQHSLPDEYKELLFVSTKNPARLLTEASFNTYLGSVCEKLQLTDLDGEPVRLTSHALRHFNIAMRYRDGRFLPQWIRREANHQSETASMGYSYPSKSEERERFAAIQEHLRGASEVMPMEVSERKYNQLLQNPAIRILPGEGLCNGTNCRPQLNRCLKCEHFEADANCADDFREACVLLEEQLEKAPNANVKAQIKRRISVYKDFLKHTGSE
ncbi:hypothetical protein LJC32_00720 [Oscillospiraceae bacterium OttesenSCG-928-F05]|nr:hypothetical protein [Oscillospiraceae bacterium OttesenSCG-928-F05]